MCADKSPAFGRLLRSYPEAAGLSQERLAENAGLSVRGISDLKRGIRCKPRSETVPEGLRRGYCQRARNTR